MEVKFFGTVSSITSCSGENEALVIVTFKSAAGISTLPLKVPLKELRESNLVPGDEFRIDVTRTGFGIP